MARLFALHSLILLSGFAFFQIATSTKPQRLVTSLIYRDSIFSPLYDPHHTAADRAKLISSISDARFAYFQAKGAEDVASAAMQTELHPKDNFLFLVNFSIGQPPMPRVAVMDTGSSFTWVQCTPYPGSVFDPSKSSTYANMSCYDSTQCIQPGSPSVRCDEVLGVCKYATDYVDGTSSEGRMATEQLTFGMSDDGESVTPKIIFGCCETFNAPMEKFWKNIHGIMGLGSVEVISIVDSLGSRFSYCLGNLNDRSYGFNQLAFGDWANLEGYSTPLQIYSGNYEVTLEGISIGAERIDIDPSIFGRVIIDTGGYKTYFPLEAYYPIEDKVTSMLDGLLAPVVSSNAKDLCYKGNMSQDLQGFPVLTLHLAEEADLVLDVNSLFYEVNKGKAFCMSITWPTTAVRRDAISIIGVMAQQNYNFGYDLNEKSLYFQRIDCELLYD